MKGGAGVDKRVKRVVYLAMLTALTVLATMFLKISWGGGYMNLGDAVILAGGAVMGPWMAIAAAVGSACADLLLGYMSYMPATFVIKGLMGFFAGRFLAGQKNKARAALVMALCEAFMIAGYFLFEMIVFGTGYAVASLLPNAVQGALSFLAAAAFRPFFARVRAAM